MHGGGGPEQSHEGAVAASFFMFGLDAQWSNSFPTADHADDFVYVWPKAVGLVLVLLLLRAGRPPRADPGIILIIERHV